MEERLKQKPSDIVKVVLYGPESTGKTTLSEQLAQHYHTLWVPEYAREYLQDKWNKERKTCENSDLLPIAVGQIKLENKLTKEVEALYAISESPQNIRPLLICDTDLLETKVYSEEYYGGYVHSELEKAVIYNVYDLYLLTYTDTPWEADDLRDRPKQRMEMFRAFENALKKYHKKYIVLKGNEKTRLQTAIKVINELL